MLNECGAYCLEWDIAPNIDIFHIITLNDKPIQWTDKWLYLGVTLKNEKRQGFLGRPNWEQLVEKRQSNFTTRVNASDSQGLSRLLLSHN